MGFVVDTQPSFISNGMLTLYWITSCSMTGSLHFLASKVTTRCSTRHIYILCFFFLFGTQRRSEKSDIVDSLVWCWAPASDKSEKKDLFLFTETLNIVFNHWKMSYTTLKWLNVTLNIYLIQQSRRRSHLARRYSWGLPVLSSIRFQLQLKKDYTMAGFRTAIRFVVTSFLTLFLITAGSADW